MSVFLDIRLIKGIAAFITISLAVLGGITLSMSLFIIPIIRDHEASTIVMLRQFRAMVDKGATYLQTSSRAEALLLFTLFCLLYTHPDSEVQSRWKYCATAIAVMIQVAWYEMVAVFPINDRLAEIEGMLAKSGNSPSADKDFRVEVTRLLGQWQRWHIGRIAVAIISAIIGIIGLL